MASPPSASSASNETVVNVQWIDWSNPEEVKEALKDVADSHIEQVASTAKEILQKSAQVGVDVAAGVAKTACKAQVTNFCSVAAPCINPVIDDIVDDSADSSKQKIPNSVNSSVKVTSKIAKNSIGKSVDVSVDSASKLHSCVTNSLS